jgi:hypothetical protein
MRKATAVSTEPPLFFVNVASKGFKFTVGVRLRRGGRPIIETACGSAAPSAVDRRWSAQ